MVPLYVIKSPVPEVLPNRCYLLFLLEISQTSFSSVKSEIEISLMNFDTLESSKSMSGSFKGK